MKYLFISEATDEKTIGRKYHQCKGMPDGMGLTYKWFEQPNSMTKLTNDEFPDFEPELIFELEEKAILTDAVSPSNISAKGFLINQKVKDILQHFNLMEHKYYPATLIIKGNRLEYFWLHFKDNSDYFLSNIDYKKTRFHLCNLLFQKTDDVTIDSYKEYIEKKMPISYISASKLTLNEVLIEKEYDLFYIRGMFLYPFVSSRLIEVLKAYNVTGFEFRKQSIL